jgi:hypothetical protein
VSIAITIAIGLICDSRRSKADMQYSLLGKHHPETRISGAATIAMPLEIRATCHGEQARYIF